MPRLQALKRGYWRVRAALASPGLLAQGYARPLRCRLNRRNPHGLFAVDLHNDKLGFFANLNFCLHLFYFCEAAGLKPYVMLTSDNYRDPRHGDSWLDYFFDRVSATPEDAHRVATGVVGKCRVRSPREMGLPAEITRRFYAELTLERAQALLGRHLRVKPDIVGETEAFAAAHFAGRQVLAVHFRGTDKQAEAPRVVWAACSAKVSAVLAARPELDTLFVASDEHGFTAFMREAFPALRVVEREDRYRSADGRPVHIGGAAEGNYDKGRDALVNVLLMSRCAVLVKSASLLSGWACVFNPQLPALMLNLPHRLEDLWFPETEIVRLSRCDGWLAPSVAAADPKALP